MFVPRSGNVPKLLGRLSGVPLRRGLSEVPADGWGIADRSPVGSRLNRSQLNFCLRRAQGLH